MPVSISWNATFRNRVRLLAGIEQEELDNDTLDILANISAEWFRAKIDRKRLKELKKKDPFIYK